ncbi:MAG: hypothetical protein U1F76_10360 [Candidatus Competibacteraceae bacterium]
MNSPATAPNIKLASDEPRQSRERFRDQGVFWDEAEKAYLNAKGKYPKPSELYRFVTPEMFKDVVLGKTKGEIALNGGIVIKRQSVYDWHNYRKNKIKKDLS